MPSDVRNRQMTRPLICKPLVTHTLPALVLSVLLGGCQGFGIAPSSAETRDPMINAPPITRGLDAGGLSTLLIAEMAGLRGDYRRASEGYLKAAQRYQSPALIERATLAARFADDPLLVEEAARRWQSISPEAQPAAEILSTLASSRGDWQEALRQSLIVSENRDDSDITRFVDTALSAGARPERLAEPLRDELSQPRLSAHFRADLTLALALTDAALGDLNQARTRLDSLGNTASQMPPYWLVASRIALDRERPSEARRAAQRGLALSPEDPRFLLLMTRADILLGNLTSARSNADALIELRRDVPLLKVGLAQLFLEEGYPDEASRLLTPVVGEPNTPSPVYLMLGDIAADQGDVENALLYYRQVPEGPDFLLSRHNAAQALIDAGRLIDARDFLRSERLHSSESYSELVIIESELLDSQGQQAEADELLRRELERVPDDGELRYFRAMRAWGNGDADTSESDLRTLIQHQPDNATALNALGYTLADQGDPEDLDEAERLIKRAHELQPNNPAIHDSLGWVAYQRGDLDTALRWIEQAWAQIPDQEVGAHLIEVLWDLGQQQRARDLLQQAQRQFSEHPLIDELIQRRPEIAR
ncbi:hypothetical protein HCU01_19740 [Halomonas cupida]|uniref:Tetratricopeptide repeat-containing protein n=1 Tax=Halomonas cupida TaxID=44933 RepID=A0A1M7I4S8_9GAMM|nr:tetratricopeptide repeat protein [Halomonas cupida]GEN24025.1 hypothetical protein HCU01_19740 [Halomonas cupida]SHM35764.1 Tetratricopeptide repeat-containing protein [Halomonas cupida]